VPADAIPKEWAVGFTPVVQAPRLAAALGLRRLMLKDDGRNPTASFKDRASSVAVALAVAEGAKAISCASTGNAASSLAGYAAMAGLPAFIFVPANAPEPKLAQLLLYGAKVFCVQGTYDEAYCLSRAACERFGWYNRNCAINPYLVEGKKTAGLEIAEQCADDVPDWVAVGVGDGCTIAGVWKGLRQMHEIGLLERLPRMLGVQAAGVAPIEEAFRTGRPPGEVKGDTLADSINVPVPRNWRKAVAAVRESGGTFVTATDEEILAAMRQTGTLAGVLAEPAAAASVAGLVAGRAKEIVGPDETALAMITGSALKDTRNAIRAGGAPTRIGPSLDEVERVVRVGV
jgi:threonine synthase